MGYHKVFQWVCQILEHGGRSIRGVVALTIVMLAVLCISALGRAESDLNNNDATRVIQGINAKFINQTIFDVTTDPAIQYTTDLGNLSNGETFYIEIQSDSEFPWDLVIYRKLPNEDRLHWISCQCMPGQKEIKTKVIDFGSYQLELKSRSAKIGINAGIVTANTDSISASTVWHIVVIKNALVYDMNETNTTALATKNIAAYNKSTANTATYEWLNKGNILNDQSKYYDAIHAYDKFIETNPQNTTVWYQKGNAFSHLDRHYEAIQAYEMALEIDPLNADAWYGEGIALDELNRRDEAIHAYDESIQAYDRVLEINLLNVDAWSGKGNVLEKLGRHEEAVTCFNQVIELAIRDYDKAIENNSQNADAWYGKGNALEQLNRHYEAIQAYNKSIEINPLDADAWSGKASVLNKLGRYDEALKCLDKATELDPKNINAWTKKAEILEHLGRWSEASDARNGVLKAMGEDPLFL